MDFKSELVFYEVPGHTNGKINQRAYIDSILKPVVKPWLEPGECWKGMEIRDMDRGKVTL